MTADNIVKANAWSNYWQKGFLTTFVDAAEENYTGPIKDYWQNVFSTVSKSQHLVDLAAGNGALLDLATETLQESNLEIQMTAIDLADITVSDFYKHHPDITVLGNTSLTNTPLADSSIDLCVSQFGFEYAEQQLAVVEIARIVKPKGRFHAVIHNTESVVTLHSKSALEQIRLCYQSELTLITTKLLRRLQKLKKSNRNIEQDQKANELRDYFNAMSSRLKEYGTKLPDSQHIDYFLNELGNLFGEKSKKMSLEEKVSIVELLENESESYHTRMQSMINASKDQAAINVLEKLFTEKQFKIERIEALIDSGQEHAWIFEAIKN